jgi:hypothetical protein
MLMHWHLRMQVRQATIRCDKRHRPGGRGSERGNAMSYSWGASHGSARAGGVALDRVGATVHGVGPASRPVESAGPLQGGRPTDTDDGMPEQQRVADELAPMVEVWQRLLAQHVPDRAGRCRTCTKGGTGLPTTPWPCVIHGIADMARRTYDAKRSHPAS